MNQQVIYKDAFKGQQALNTAKSIASKIEKTISLLQCIGVEKKKIDRDLILNLNGNKLSEIAEKFLDKKKAALSAFSDETIEKETNLLTQQANEAMAKIVRLKEAIDMDVYRSGCNEFPFGRLEYLTIENGCVSISKESEVSILNYFTLIADTEQKLEMHKLITDISELTKKLQTLLNEINEDFCAKDAISYGICNEVNINYLWLNEVLTNGFWK